MCACVCVCVWVEGGGDDEKEVVEGVGDTYVKAKATRAPLTTIKSRMFHKSRK